MDQFVDQFVDTLFGHSFFFGYSCWIPFSAAVLCIQKRAFILLDTCFDLLGIPFLDTYVEPYLVCLYMH